MNKKKIKKENLGEHRLHLYRQRLNIREILTWTHLLRISVVFQLKQLNITSEIYLVEFQNWKAKRSKFWFRYFSIQVKFELCKIWTNQMVWKKCHIKHLEYLLWKREIWYNIKKIGNLLWISLNKSKLNYVSWFCQDFSNLLLERRNLFSIL